MKQQLVKVVEYIEMRKRVVTTHLNANEKNERRGARASERARGRRKNIYKYIKSVKVYTGRKATHQGRARARKIRMNFISI